MGYGGAGDWVNKEEEPLRQRTLADYSLKDLESEIRRRRKTKVLQEIQELEMKLAQLQKELSNV